MNRRLIIVIFILIILCILGILRVDRVCRDRIICYATEELVQEPNIPSYIESQQVIEKVFSHIENFKCKNILEDIVDELYPHSAYIWNRLKKEGYSDFAIAGILGNFMAETGGQTLVLNPSAYNSSGYYGVAQWSMRFYPEVYGRDIEGQIDFLLSNIVYEINSFGFKYYEGFNHDIFKNMNNASEAALAFAKCYERCSSLYYSVRQENAENALEYFSRR